MPIPAGNPCYNCGKTKGWMGHGCKFFHFDTVCDAERKSLMTIESKCSRMHLPPLTRRLRLHRIANRDLTGYQVILAAVATLYADSVAGTASDHVYKEERIIARPSPALPQPNPQSKVWASASSNKQLPTDSMQYLPAPVNPHEPLQEPTLG